MNTDNPTHNRNTGWQILGELELPASTSVEVALFAWLREIFHPLQLQEELLNEISLSAQDAVTRAIHAGTVFEYKNVHLTVFVPPKLDGREKAWGFFRVEKIEDATDEQAGGDHAVEFYLYGEGD